MWSQGLAALPARTGVGSANIEPSENEALANFSKEAQRRPGRASCPVLPGPARSCLGASGSDLIRGYGVVEGRTGRPDLGWRGEESVCRQQYTLTPHKTSP